MKLEIDVANRCRHETIDIAIKAFELSQSLREKWLTADYAAKRRILEITCLNFSLEGVTLVPSMRKPFDILAEGLDLKNSRGDWHSFEPLISVCIDAAFSPSPEAVVAEKVMKLTA